MADEVASFECLLFLLLGGRVVDWSAVTCSADGNWSCFVAVVGELVLLLLLLLLTFLSFHHTYLNGRALQAIIDVV